MFPVMPVPKKETKKTGWNSSISSTFKNKSTLFPKLGTMGRVIIREVSGGLIGV